MSKVGPAASEKIAAELKKQEKLVDIQAAADLEWLLGQPQFRRWAIGLVYAGQFCGVNKTIWDGSSKIHYLEGRRSIGVDVLKTFLNFPELYSRLEQERIEAELGSLGRLKLKKLLDEDNEDA